MKHAVLMTIAVMAMLTSALADQWVDGYYRSNGTYVQGYWRSDPDNKYWNNWSSWGNTNPYTNEKGYDLPKLEDYIEKPSYYDYTYRPFNYTPRFDAQTSPLYVAPSYNHYYELPSTSAPYVDPYGSTYENSTEDNSSPFDYTPGDLGYPSSEYDLDGDE